MHEWKSQISILCVVFHFFEWHYCCYIHFFQHPVTFSFKFKFCKNFYQRKYFILRCMLCVYIGYWVYNQCYLDFRYMALVDGPNEVFMVDRDNTVFHIPGLNFRQRKDLKLHLRDTLLDGVSILKVYSTFSEPNQVLFAFFDWKT